MLMEVESDPESVSGTGSPPKVNQLFFQVSVKSAHYFCSNPAHRQTNLPGRITSVLAEVIIHLLTAFWSSAGQTTVGNMDTNPNSLTIAPESNKTSHLFIPAASERVKGLTAK